MLDKKTIKTLFSDLNNELAKNNTHGELFLVGGAAMCLALDARASTKDIDALFKPSKTVREAAKKVAEKNNIDPYWLNDAVKGFLSNNADFSSYLELDHLKVSIAQPEYLLAMKCLSMRLGEEFQDLNDVRFLIKLLNITHFEQAKKLICLYYPLERFPQKTLYVLEEILSED